MGEPHPERVIDKLCRQFAVGERALAALGTPPASQMDLIDRNRRVGGMGLRAGRHPVAVGPAQPARLPHDRSGARRVFRSKADRVRLQRADGAARPAYLILVGGTLGHAGQEDFPHPRRAAPAHRVAAAVPGVEIADHRHPFGIRRPDGEMHAPGPLMGHRMGAQLRPEPAVIALADQVLVHLAQHGAKAIGIVKVPDGAILGLGAQRIGLVRFQRPLENLARRRVAGHLHRLCPALHQPEPRHLRQDHPQDVALRTQHRERVAMPPLGQRPRVGIRQPCLGPLRHSLSSLQSRVDAPDVFHVTTDRPVG